MTSYVATTSGGATIYTSNGTALPPGTVPTLATGDTLTILNGAVASGIQTTGAASVYVSSGGELLSSTINNGSVYVSGGGIASANTENSTYEYVYSGGSSFHETIIDTFDHAGGTSVASGATIDDVTVNNGGLLSVTSGANISGLTIGNGATVTPGLTSATTTAAGAAVTTAPAGTAYTASLSGGTTIYTYLSAGVTITTATPPVLQGGDILYVNSGAVASGVNSVDNGAATVYVSSGGELLSSTINNGATYVYFGGIASGNVENSTVETVYSGGSSVHETQLITVGDAAGGLYLQAGAIATGDVIGSGGSATIYAGATATGTAITNGGTVLNYGTVAATTLAGSASLTNYNVVSGAAVSSGAQLLNYGSAPVSTTVGSGGAYVGPSSPTLTVSSGGAASFAPAGTTYTAVLSGGVTVYTYVSGGTTYNQSTPPVLRGGDLLIVQSGAVASGVESVIGGVAAVYVSSGGELLSSTINNGYTFVSAGGLASGNTLVSDEGTTYSGGHLVGNTIVGGTANNGGADTYTIASGGIARGDTVLSGGGVAAAAGAVVSTLSVGSSGTFTNPGGNTVSGITVTSGGIVTNAGTIAGGTVASGGFLSNTGTASALTVGSGGAYAGPASGVTVNAGGASTTGYAGTTYTASLSGGVTVYTYTSNGTTLKTATPPVLQGGDTLNILSGAVASGVQSVQTGVAVVNVSSGGELLSSTINNGYTYVSAGGIASGNIENSTPEYVLSGGLSVNETHIVTVGDTVGGLYISSGGVASGDTVASGDSMIVYAGGTANGTVIGNAGSATNYGFMSATAISGSSVMSGGALTNLGIAKGTTVTSGGLLSNTTAGSLIQTLVAAGGAEANVGQIACFLHGTRIATPGGDTAIENLRIGDEISLAEGGSAPVRWIGRRAYNRQLAAGNPDVQPVLIRQGALADNVPSRDLYVSPKHAMFLDGVLIHACQLVNGVTVLENAEVGRLEYLHVELEKHAVILAEGAPTESFVDCDNRGIFQNVAEFQTLYPDAVSSPWAFCAPLVEHGPLADEARRRIALRAGLAMEYDVRTVGSLLGHLDHVGQDAISGWAMDSEHPDVPVRIDVYDRGVLVASTVADRYRGDLVRARFGAGRHGFNLRLPADTARGGLPMIDIRRARDGELLQGSIAYPAERLRS